MSTIKFTLFHIIIDQRSSPIETECERDETERTCMLRLFSLSNALRRHPPATCHPEPEHRARISVGHGVGCAGEGSAPPPFRVSSSDDSPSLVRRYNREKLGGQEVASCSQCGRPAIVEVNGNPLCLDCDYKLLQSAKIRDRMLKEQHNYIVDQMEAVTGMYGVSPKFDLSEPVPVIHQGPMTFHNIKVDRSVVGVINTAEVQKIDVALSHIATGGDVELQRALMEFTEAVLKERALSTDSRNEILEQLGSLTAQVATTPKERKQGILKPIVKALSDTASGLTALAPLWEKLYPMLKSALGW